MPGLDVEQLVAHHRGPPEVELEILGGAQQQRAPGLATVAALLGAVGTEVDGVELGAARAQHAPQRRHRLVDPRQRKEPAPHPRLVRDHHHREPGGVQRAHRVRGAREQLEVGRVGEVAALDHQRAVAIQERRGAHAVAALACQRPLAGALEDLGVGVLGRRLARPLPVGPQREPLGRDRKPPPREPLGVPGLQQAQGPQRGPRPAPPPVPALELPALERQHLGASPRQPAGRGGAQGAATAPQHHLGVGARGPQPASGHLEIGRARDRRRAAGPHHAVSAQRQPPRRDPEPRAPGHRRAVHQHPHAAASRQARSTARSPTASRQR